MKTIVKQNLFSSQVDLESKIIYFQDIVFSEQGRNENIFKKSPIVKMIKSRVIHSPEVRNQLSEVINCWVKWLKGLSVIDFESTSFMNYKGESTNWDPILEATASWFFGKLIALNENDKKLIYHFVLIKSAKIFCHELKSSFPTTKNIEEMERFLNSLPQVRIEPPKTSEGNVLEAQTLLHQAWAMMELMSCRLAYVAKRG